MSLIDSLINEGYLKTPNIIKAFRMVDRADFVRPEEKQDVEFNAPLPIGHGQTVSQPATVAFMLELLGPQRGEKILDVGSGSGWTTALLSEIVGEKGRVFSLELIKELKAFGETNVRKYGFIDSGRTKMFKRDGYKGLPEHAPFDKILVSAAAKEVPRKLIEQLDIGGKMVIPVGTETSIQDIVVIDKSTNDEIIEKRYHGFMFVPLVKSK